MDGTKTAAAFGSALNVPPDNVIGVVKIGLPSLAPAGRGDLDGPVLVAVQMPRLSQSAAPAPPFYACICIVRGTDALWRAACVCQGEPSINDASKKIGLRGRGR